jgi:membrane protein CcdC involved in cytochrome C biogenesis
METAPVLASIAGAAAVLAWRVRETRRPVTVAKLVAPPLGMSTGFLMFLVPETRVPAIWALGAFAVGALLFSYPLIHTSRLVRQGDTISLQRSRAFLWILLGLFAARFVLRSYVVRFVSIPQTGAIFFVLAFGMIVPWRLTLYARYRRLRAESPGGPDGVAVQP